MIKMWPSMPSRKKWHQTYCRHRTTSEKNNTSVCHGLFDWKHHGEQSHGCIGPRLGQQGRVWCVLECTRGRQRNLSTRSRGVVEIKTYSILLPCTVQTSTAIPGNSRHFCSFRKGIFNYWEYCKSQKGFFFWPTTQTCWYFFARTSRHYRQVDFQ